MPFPVRCRSRAISIRNWQRPDKPNEDYFQADDLNGLYLLADGVTTTPSIDQPYPDPAGGQLAARTFCEHTYTYLTAHLNEVRASPTHILRTAVTVGNAAVYSLNVAHRRYEQANFLDRDYMGTVAAMAAIVGDMLHVLYVGDVMALHGRGGHLRLISEIQTESVHAYQEKVRRSRLVAPQELKIAVRKEYRNRSHATGLNGEPVGYGVLTGEEGVLDFVRQVELHLEDQDRVLLLSDGFQPLVSAALANRAEMERISAWIQADSGSLSRLAAENRRFDIIFDDQTAIVIEVQAST